MRLGLVAFDAAPHFFAAGLAAGLAGDFFAACVERPVHAVEQTRR